MGADYWKNRLNADQRQAIMTLDMLTRAFTVSAETLKSRMTDYKYFNRDIKMMEAVSLRILKKAIENLPPDTADMLLRQSRDYVLDVKRRSPIRRHEEIIMPMDDEYQMIQIVVDSKCAMCLKTDAECDACKVRKLLRKYTNEPDPGFRNCGFQGCEMGPNKYLNKEDMERID